MNDLSIFKQFAKTSTHDQMRSNTNAVIYTRVSTKEQADNNASLDTQRKYCELFAKRKGYTIVEYFGGTYESARSDERVEFQRMLSYVKRHKNVAYIIVYSYDRFSRTGANGASISEQLKKQGIKTLSATQEVDTSTSAGAFQQNLYYIFSQFDNELRRDKIVTGIKEKLRRGYWMGNVPIGYTNLGAGKHKEQNIVINEDGELLKIAFELKANLDLSMAEISRQLKEKGLELTPKRIGVILRNPFYCGLIVSSHLPNEVIEGKHPPLVSKSLFLRVNKIVNRNGNYGVSHHGDDENLPLKQFIKAASCGTNYTGYLVKKKGLYYYKNNRRGSKENRSAKIMHQKFIAELQKYQLADKRLIVPYREIIKNAFVQEFQYEIEQAEKGQNKILELQQKIDRLEERYVFEEISREQFDKFKSRLDSQIEELHIAAAKKPVNLSNLNKSINIALHMSLNLSKTWELGNLPLKKTIQHIVFPEGILFDYENDCYRTLRVNSLFMLIPSISKNTSENKKGKDPISNDLSLSVLKAGLEPARPKWSLDFKSNVSTNSTTSAC